MSGIHEVRGAIHGKGYVLIRPLVEGSESVFEARHERVPGAYVVRLFPSDISSRSEAALRIQGGARLATILRHPGIVQVLDFNVAGEDPAFVVMEHVEGQSLEDLMAKDGMLPLQLAIDVIGQIAEALRAAHALGIIHSDLHPDVIRVKEDGNRKIHAKVMGFGWAKELRAAGRKREGRSTYVAPEQAAVGGQSIDERADQFSLAAIAYEMLAGCSHLTEESSDLADPEARRHRQPPSLAELVLGLPVGLDEVLRRALSYDPRERFPRLQDFASALQRVTDSRATLAAGRTEATWEWPGAASPDAREDAASSSLTPGPVSVASGIMSSAGDRSVAASPTEEAAKETPPPQVLAPDWLGLGDRRSGNGDVAPDVATSAGSLESLVAALEKSSAETAGHPSVEDDPAAASAEATPPPVLATLEAMRTDGESTPDLIGAGALASALASPIATDKAAETPPLLEAAASAISSARATNDVATPPPITTPDSTPDSSLRPNSILPLGATVTDSELSPVGGTAATPPPISFPVMTFSAPDDMRLIGAGEPMLAIPPISSSPVPAPKPRARTRVLFLGATIAVVCAAISVMSGMRKGTPTTATPTTTPAEVAAPSPTPKASPTAAAGIASPPPVPTSPTAPIAPTAPVAQPSTAEVAPSAAEPTALPVPTHSPAVAPRSAAASTTAEIRGDRARSSRGHVRRSAAHSASSRRDRRSR